MMMIMSNNCLIHSLLLLLPAVVATTPSSYSYTLAPQANEGYWHEMPVSVRNHLNKTGAATRFWRKSGRHPSNTFHDVAGLALDQFSIGVWVKLNPQFWQTFRSVCVLVLFHHCILPVATEMFCGVLECLFSMLVVEV